MRAFRLSIPASREDLATSLLFDLGTTGIALESSSNPEESVLLAYFNEQPRLAEALESTLAGLEGTLSETVVEDVDWVARYRASFRAFDAPPFRIVPAWEDLPEENALTLRVDPGRAFGTGTHESTRLCLQALGSLPPADTVLDVGTGSGILAVAAARLGSRRILGIDSDPEAIAQATRHAFLNSVPVMLFRGDLLEAVSPRASFDLILANLTAPLLARCLPRIASLRAQKGHLVLAGLLESDLPDLDLSTIGPFQLRRDGEWVAVVR